MTATAVRANAPPGFRPACTRNADLFHHEDGDRRRDWWWQAYTICHYCPIRRRCIETELAHGRPEPGSVWGGWVFHTSGGLPRAHPGDGDLYRRHYPRETT